LTSGSTLALREPIALAVHFEDVDVVGEAIQQENTLVHSSNGRLLVTIVEPRS
jgi:hypothetical protein